jgi:superkiller protein 3
MASVAELFDQAYDLLCEGKPDEAIDRYKQVLALEPGHIDALHELAMAYADKDMLDEAIETIKRMVELTPDDPMVYTDLSRFYQRKGMVPEAEAQAAKARVLDWKEQLQEKKEGTGN